MIYGVLYREFKSKYYFFEITKLYFKLLVVFLINILSDLPMLCGNLIIFLLVVYLHIINRFNPNVYYKINNLDRA
jgi:hypothetical protein